MGTKGGERMKKMVVFLTVLLTVLIIALVICARTSPLTPPPPSVKPPAPTKTPTKTQTKPMPVFPTTPSVKPPAPTKTPTLNQSETPMPVLEVAWEEIKLPPLKYGFDGIGGFLVEDGGRTITVYRCIGPVWTDPKATSTDYTKWSVWKTENGGNWNEIREEVLTWEEIEQSRFHPPMTTGGKGGGRLDNPDILMWEKEIIKQSLNPFTSDSFPGGWKIVRDQKNIFMLAIFTGYDASNSGVSPEFYRLFFSTDDGKTWKQLNFPSQYAKFDAYPETPELTLLKDIQFAEPKMENGSPVYGYLPGIDRDLMDIISSEDGICLYLMSNESEPNGASFLRAIIIKSPN